MRPRPPHLQREITRHGKAVWYVRVGGGQRHRLRAEYGTPEFDAEYRAALTGKPACRAAPSNKSLAWLLARYRETTAWSELSRGLFRWAKKAGLVKVDPTAGVGNPKCKTGDGFIAWTEDHVAAYQARWPVGTRQRVWLDVLLYTGLRRGDAVRLGRQHVSGSIKTEKSGYKVEVPVIILPVLQKTIDAGPCGDLTFIVGENGRPLTKETFGNVFKAACKAAGVPGSAHGVRKIAATTAANAGATEAELMAIFGWTDPKMAAHYTRTANRKRLAADAMEKLTGTSIPAPKPTVRAKGGKSK